MLSHNVRAISGDAFSIPKIELNTVHRIAKENALEASAYSFPDRSRFLVDCPHFIPFQLHITLPLLN